MYSSLPQPCVAIFQSRLHVFPVGTSGIGCEVMQERFFRTVGPRTRDAGNSACKVGQCVSFNMQEHSTRRALGFAATTIDDRSGGQWRGARGSTAIKSRSVCTVIPPGRREGGLQRVLTGAGSPTSPARTAPRRWPAFPTPALAVLARIRPQQIH